jgi:lipopolysaccharide biosynthesis glycosyltransferase
LTLFYQDINDAELSCLKKTIQSAGGLGEARFHEADISEFKDLKALQGDWMTYLRLLLPRLMPEAGTILYLDSDLIVNTDACAFFDHHLGDFPIGAVDGASVSWVLDREFLKRVGLTDDDRCFNAGILLLNAELWRKNGLVEQAVDMARTHSPYLTSHDQSVLNGLFSRNFYRIPAQFNLGVSPQDKLLPDKDCIYHFVGSPKPWDLLGKYFHGNWPIWQAVIKETAFNWNDFLAGHLTAYCKRAWTLRRSYIRTLQRK